MIIVRLDPRRPDPEKLKPVARVAARGGLVVYPTETVYGLGTNPLLEEAVERVYEAKQRPRNKPLPVLAASLQDVERIARLTPEARRLAEEYWPGPLTIILEAKPALPHTVTACTGRVAVRIPGHPVARLLARLAGGLIIGTSANISGMKPPRTLEEALRQLEGRGIEAAVDAGPTPLGRPSTIIDLTTKPPRLVRQGPIPWSEIERRTQH